MIAGLLLAAGHGRRFGGDKLLAPLRGRPVVAWSLNALVPAVDESWVVVPPDAAALRDALAGQVVHFVVHAGRDAGMGSSIAAGIARLPAAARAVLIALGDQPLASPAVASSLCARWLGTGAPVVAPSYRDGRGHPVLFDRSCFAALGALRGDEGARSVITEMMDRVELVEVDETMPLDVDTPQALEAVARSLAGG